MPVLNLTLLARLAKATEPMMGAVAGVIRRALKLTEEAAEVTLEVFVKAMSATLARLKAGAKAVKEFFEDLWKAFLKWVEEFLATGKFTKKLEQGLDKPFFETAGYAVKKIETLEALYGQSKDYTCVATSLRMVLEGKGVSYSEEYIARELGTTKDGARVLDIPEALDGMYQSGIKAIAEKNIKFSELAAKLEEGDMAIVSIRHVIDDRPNYHAVVIDGITNGQVVIRDPLPQGIGSSYEISVADFKKLFARKAIIIKR